MSSCGGKLVSKPALGLSAEECAAQCENLVFPERCKAFSFYAFQDSPGGDLEIEGHPSSLCFFFGLEVDAVVSSSCVAIDGAESSFLQQSLPGASGAVPATAALLVGRANASTTARGPTLTCPYNDDD